MKGCIRLVTACAVFFLWVGQAAANPATTAVIGQRMEQLGTKGSLRLNGRNIAARGLAQKFYGNRKFAPAWTEPGKARQLMALINASATHGLNPDDYFQIQIASALLAPARTRSAAQAADLDILMTDALMRYAYHRAFGKVNGNEVDNNINFRRQLFRDNPPEVSVEKALASESLDAYIEGALPHSPLYQKLRKGLVEFLKIASTGGWEPIPAGPLIRPGNQDPRVPGLRRRLMITGDLPPGIDLQSDIYDDDVIAGMKSFQLRHQLEIDSVIGTNSLTALNVPVETRVDQLRLSLERLRWIQGESMDNLVAVNIAGFRVFLLQDGEMTWSARAMVGKTYRQTPVFRGDMTYLEFNPTWTVPPGILRNDILPKIKKDPDYLSNHNMRVIDQDGASIDPADVDWQSFRGSIPYKIRQDPGPDNALGTVKFIFPNPHLVFIHDTPHRALYDKRERAFSSGCIRIEDPLRLAELVLNDPQNHSRGQLEAIVSSGATRRVSLKQEFPVLIVYLTASIDENNNVRFYKDIYDRDRRVLNALNGPVIFDVPGRG